MLKDLLEDILSDSISEGLWQWACGAPAWAYYLLSAGSFGAAAYFYYGQDANFWTWPTLLLAAVMLIVGIISD